MESINKILSTQREKSNPVNIVRNSKLYFSNMPKISRKFSHSNKQQLNNKFRASQTSNFNTTATSFWNGKMNKFTNSFQNRMFEDTRISSIHLRLKREELRKINLDK